MYLWVAYVCIYGCGSCVPRACWVSPSPQLSPIILPFRSIDCTDWWNHPIPMHWRTSQPDNKTNIIFFLFFFLLLLLLFSVSCMKMTLLWRTGFGWRGQSVTAKATAKPQRAGWLWRAFRDLSTELLSCAREIPRKPAWGLRNVRELVNNGSWNENEQTHAKYLHCQSSFHVYSIEVDNRNVTFLSSLAAPCDQRPACVDHVWWLSPRLIMHIQVRSSLLVEPVQPSFLPPRLGWVFLQRENNNKKLKKEVDVPLFLSNYLNLQGDRDLPIVEDAHSFTILWIYSGLNRRWYDSFMIQQ